MINIFNFFPWLTKLVHILWSKINLLFSKNQNVNKYRCSANNNPAQKFLKVPIVKGTPIFGTLFDVIKSGGASRLHQYIDNRHQQYGPIFRENLGGSQDAVFVAKASLMRSVFFYEGQCPRHPLPDAWQLYNKNHNTKRGLFFMDGNEWLQQRRLLNRLLLNGNLDWMKNEIEISTEKLITKWKDNFKRSEAIHNEFCIIEDIEGELYRWSIDVICAVMFGNNYTNYTHVTKELDEFSKIVYKIFESSSSLMNFPPKLAKALNLKIWKDFEFNVTEVLKKGATIIDIFITLIADFDETEGSTLYGKLKSSGMSLDMIQRIFVDLVIAAGDTTAYSSEWALYLLAQDQKIQQTILNEALCDEQNNSYLNGLIKETLRLYPVAPFIGRYLAFDSKIGDYFIEKDTLVLISLYTAGRDASHFPQPLLAQPERWRRNKESDQLEGVLHAHGSLPFGIGIRSCIGKKIALIQIQKLLREVVCNFKIESLNDSAINPILRLVTIPDKPLKLAIKLRNCS